MGGVTSRWTLFGVGCSDCGLSFQFSFAWSVPLPSNEVNNIVTPRTVRFLDHCEESPLSSMRSLFVVEDAPNVFLETIKRGEDDCVGSGDYDWENGSTAMTVVLRLYEAFGGHTKAQLRIASYLPVSRAYVANLLEDDGEELDVMRGGATETCSTLKLEFRGFEVKTVKLVVGPRKVSGANQGSANLLSSCATIELTCFLSVQRPESWVNIDKRRLFSS